MAVNQSSTLPPAQPAYVLRGHAAQVHAVHFFHDNLRLLSGDADGWIVVWNIPIRRSVAVWRAHKDTILGLGSWSDDKVITHGRDGKLNVWQYINDEEATFSTTLPVVDATSDRKQPWLLHSLTVNTLNFCAFAMLHSRGSTLPARSTDPSEKEGILIATPGVQDGCINITSLPDEARVATVPTPKDVKTGMVMAIAICHLNGVLTVLAGYESGHTAIMQQEVQSKQWQTTYINKSHSEPVLSLGICAELQCYFTSSADAIIARHSLDSDSPDTKTTRTKHAGQQSLIVRSDQKIFATAGWDGRARVYSSKTMSELAVLKWHKEGCYALAFAKLLDGLGAGETGDSVSRRDMTVSQRRVHESRNTHWLAAGSKDGKISLWDVY